MRKRFTSLTILCLAAAGCAPADESRSEEALGQGQQAVFDGNDGLATPDNMEHPQVVHLVGSALCTATLVASNVFLTAAHCVDLPVAFKPVLHPLAQFNSPPEVTDGLKAMLSGEAAVVLLNPNWIPGSQFSGVDLALVLTDSPVSRKLIKPLPMTPSLSSALSPILLGGGHTDPLCTNGAPSPITKLFLGPGIVTTGPGNFDRGMFHEGGSWACTSDSGGPIVSSTTGEILSVAAQRELDNTALYGAPLWAPEGLDEWQWLMANAFDRDDDGLQAAVDNCDMVFNPDQLDTDGDDVGDACDVCPDTPHDELDTDGDGVVNCIQPCPGGDVTIDDDSDDCADDCDPCPEDGNLSDGFGNVDTSCGDVDHDGVCNSVDNCIDVSNGAQVNTNLLSETYHTPNAPWGDACEPVPQPRTSADLPTTTILFEVNDPNFHQVTTRSVFNHLLVEPQPSRRMPQADPVVAPLPSAPVPSVPTHFRFCQKKPGLVCTAVQNVSDRSVSSRSAPLRRRIQTCPTTA